MDRIEDLGPWPLRACWVALALIGPLAIGDALDSRSTPVTVVVAAGLWLGWAAALVAMLVPRNEALTAMRTLVPGGLAVILIALATGSTADAASVAAAVIAAVATLWVLAPWIGEAWVDGSSYGPERRFPLRPPVLLGYGIVPIVWLAVFAGLTSGPLLLAARQWVAGSAAIVVGAAAVVLGIRSLHQLSRRWVVLVPAGLVLHDTLTMPDPQLLLRRMIAGVGPAAADTEADDLTAGAPGLALQLDLREPVDLLVRSGGRSTETRSSLHLLFTPSRPRHLLDAIGERRIPIS